jgi:hypothetical protein
MMRKHGIGAILIAFQQFYFKIGKHILVRRAYRVAGITKSAHFLSDCLHRAAGTDLRKRGHSHYRQPEFMDGRETAKLDATATCQEIRHGQAPIL